MKEKIIHKRKRNYIKRGEKRDWKVGEGRIKREKYVKRRTNVAQREIRGSEIDNL